MSHAKPLRAILFDFGNVLIRWDMRNIYGELFPSAQAVDAFLDEIRFYEWNALMDKGLPFSEGVARASSEFPHYAHLFRLFDERWLDTVREPIEGSVAIARRLKEAGHPLYLLSNISEEKFPQARKVHDFLSIFDEFILSSECGVVKPNPAIFKFALQRINRTPAEVVFVDDLIANVEAARGLGIESIHFLSPAQLETELKKIGLPAKKEIP